MYRKQANETSKKLHIRCLNRRYIIWITLTHHFGTWRMMSRWGLQNKSKLVTSGLLRIGLYTSIYYILFHCGLRFVWFFTCRNSGLLHDFPQVDTFIIQPLETLLNQFDAWRETDLLQTSQHLGLARSKIEGWRWRFKGETCFVVCPGTFCLHVLSCLVVAAPKIHTLTQDCSFMQSFFEGLTDALCLRAMNGFRMIANSAWFNQTIWSE